MLANVENKAARRGPCFHQSTARSRGFITSVKTNSEAGAT